MLLLYLDNTSKEAISDSSQIKEQKEQNSARETFNIRKNCLFYTVDQHWISWSIPILHDKVALLINEEMS